jgi:hypothetical protein
VDKATRESILRAGIAAPSADNSQPWLFRWQDDVLDLWIDRSRSGGLSDSHYVLSDVATGVCLENMLIRARSLGYVADVDVFPGEDALWAARLRWRRETDSGEREPLAEAIAERHTDRRFPWSGPIPAEARARLTEQAHSTAGVELHWLDEKKTKKAAVDVLRQAETLRFKSTLLHAELFSSIAFASGWRASCAEGLAPATLAVEPPLRPVFQLLARPAVMSAFNRLGAAPMLGFRSAHLPVRLSPGLCLLSVQSTDRPSILAAGRALDRVWLQATLERLSVQPFAAAGVLSLGFVAIEPRFSRSIDRLKQAMRALCPQGHGLLFLRMGRAKSKPRQRSGRRALASFDSHI